MLKKQILLICILCCTQLSVGWITDVLKIGKALWKYGNKAAEMQGQLDVYKNVFNMLTGDDSDSMEEIKEKLNEISNKIDKLEKNMDNHFAVIQKMLGNLPASIALDDQKKDYRLLVAPIDDLYNQLMQYIENGYENHLWQKFAEHAVNKVGDNVAVLESLIAPTGQKSVSGKGLIELIGDHGMTMMNEACMSTQSLQFILHDLLKSVILTEMKVLQILGSCYRAMYPLEREWKPMVTTAAERFEGRYVNYLSTFAKAMGKVSGAARSCVPNQGWKLGETYFKVSPMRHTYYKTLDQKAWACAAMRDGPCQGQPECIEADNLDVCKKGDKYLWIKINDDRYGESGNCPGSLWSEHVGTFSWIAGISKTCFCQCPIPTQHSISLDTSQVDYKRNMVVTGAKIVEMDKVFHIQLQQGKMTSSGEIDQNTVEWVPLRANAQKVNLSYYYRRIYLTNFKLPEGYVLVGVQFVEHTEKNHQEKDGLYLKVFGKKFDPATGILLAKTHQVTLDATTAYKNVPFDKHSPIHSVHPKYLRRSGKYVVTLETSDKKHDVAQSTLPLFDGLAVEPDPPAPLSGLGLYHKSVENFAGFISLQVHSLQYDKHIEEMLRKYKPGTVFEECNEPSCTPDNILDIAEQLYKFMKKANQPEYKRTMDARKDDDFTEIAMRLKKAEFNLNTAQFIHLIKKAITFAQPGKLADWQQETLPKEAVKLIDAKYASLISGAGGNEILRDMKAVTSKGISELKDFLLSSLVSRNIDGGFIKAMRDSSSKGQQFCSSETLLHVLTHIFQKIVITDIKATSGLFFASQAQGQGWDAEEDIENFKSRVMAYVKDFAGVMKKAPGDVTACGPIPQGDKSIEIRGLGNRVLFYYNKIQNPRISCEIAVDGEIIKWHEPSDTCPEKPTNCFSADDAHTCRGPQKQLLWVKEGPRKPGRAECVGGTSKSYTNKAQQQCICSCSTESTYVNLELTMSDVDEHKVVTGARFIRKRNILFIQIKQGKLLPHGWIDGATEEWVPVNEESEDLVPITVTENKFRLNEVMFSSSYAIVGLQFYHNDGFFIRAVANKFEYSTGVLLEQQLAPIPSKTAKSIELKTRIKRENLGGGGRNNTRRAKRLGRQRQPQQQSLRSRHRREVRRRDTSLSGNSVTTPVPLFDGSDVMTSPPTALGGIAVVQKTVKGNVNYISLKLHSLQYQKNLEDFINKEKLGQVFLGD